MKREFINLDYLFNCSDYAFLNRIKQLDILIKKEDDYLKYQVIQKGRLGSIIGYVIQTHIYEKENILNHNKLLKEVINKKCQHSRKCSRKKLKNQATSALIHSEI